MREPAQSGAGQDSPEAQEQQPAPQRRSLDVAHDIVLRARAGDDGAFAQLVEHYDEALRRLAHFLLGDSDRIDRVLQDAYVKAYRALPQFRRGSSPGIWLFRIVYRACLDELRRQLRRPPRRSDAPTRPAEEPRSAFELALRRLPADQCAVVLLIDGEGFEHAAVAEVLDLTPTSVTSRLIKARSALRAAMAGDEEAYGVVTGATINPSGSGPDHGTGHQGGDESPADRGEGDQVDQGAGLPVGGERSGP